MCVCVCVCVCYIVGTNSKCLKDSGLDSGPACGPHKGEKLSKILNDVHLKV